MRPITDKFLICICLCVSSVFLAIAVNSMFFCNSFYGYEVLSDGKQLGYIYDRLIFEEQVEAILFERQQCDNAEKESSYTCVEYIKSNFDPYNLIGNTLLLEQVVGIYQIHELLYAQNDEKTSSEQGAETQDGILLAQAEKLPQLAEKEKDTQLDSVAHTATRTQQTLSVSRGVLDANSRGCFANPAYGKITSGYGMRDGRLHQGIDIAANFGENIYAAEDGMVILAELYGGYGNLIKIQHKNNIATLYAHCSKFLVSKGQSVNKGQVIGLIGNSGNSHGPHLHFEVKKDGITCNPQDYLN